ncbi:hypothetical protein GQ55_5G422600 [Panicum hallii var. hallii]|uniref:Uncharacterized protein n=1 Tax=Panicum hallii var. hallii TaxID=1504633 RepID=A0A2T7DP31_9POAL|nr:hypothetical protein GQ55_5G422600 [Panicum hallii var. hallii]
MLCPQCLLGRARRRFRSEKISTPGTIERKEIHATATRTRPSPGRPMTQAVEQALRAVRPFPRPTPHATSQEGGTCCRDGHPGRTHDSRRVIPRPIPARRSTARRRFPPSPAAWHLTAPDKPTEPNRRHVATELPSEPSAPRPRTGGHSLHCLRGHSQQQARRESGAAKPKKRHGCGRRAGARAPRGPLPAVRRPPPPPRARQGGPPRRGGRGRALRGQGKGRARLAHAPRRRFGLPPGLGVPRRRRAAAAARVLRPPRRRGVPARPAGAGRRPRPGVRVLPVRGRRRRGGARAAVPPRVPPRLPRRLARPPARHLPALPRPPPPRGHTPPRPQRRRRHHRPRLRFRRPRRRLALIVRPRPRRRALAHDVNTSRAFFLFAITCS